jgi:hypothetical protein
VHGNGVVGVDAQVIFMDFGMETQFRQREKLWRVYPKILVNSHSSTFAAMKAALPLHNKNQDWQLSDKSRQRLMKYKALQNIVGKTLQSKEIFPKAQLNIIGLFRQTLGFNK